MKNDVLSKEIVFTFHAWTLIKTKLVFAAWMT